MGFHVCAKDSCFCRKTDEAYGLLTESLHGKEFQLEEGKALLADAEKKVQDAETKVQGSC